MSSITNNRQRVVLLKKEKQKTHEFISFLSLDLLFGYPQKRASQLNLK